MNIEKKRSDLIENTEREAKFRWIRTRKQEVIYHN